MLQEYEDLLHGDTDMGPKISQAIERILGLPTLTKSRDSLKAALDKAEERVALAAQGDQKTREFGNQLQSLVEEREVLTADLFRHEKDLEILRARKVAIEDDMRRRERMASLLDKRDRLASEVEALEGLIQKKKEEISKAMAPAWSAVIRPQLAAAVSAHRTREAELQSAVTRAQVLHSLAKGHDPACPTCLQIVSPDAQAKIRSLLPGGADGSPEADQRELAGVRRRLDALDAQLADSNPEALRLLWSDLEERKREVYSKSAEIEEIGKQLTGDAEDELKGLRGEYDSVVRQIAALEDGGDDEAVIERAGVDGDAVQALADLERDDLAMLIDRAPPVAVADLHAGAAQDERAMRVVLELVLRVDPTADPDVARRPASQPSSFADRDERGGREQTTDPVARTVAAQDRDPDAKRDGTREDEGQWFHGGDDTRRAWKGPKEPPRHVGVDAIATVSVIRPLRAAANITGAAVDRSMAMSTRFGAAV